ncbi:MAG: pyridoxal phosphate-dependent aminotransferase family protein [Candidatus Omnitrophica bacterium]|nr:pyridoxal phosphate-dependent aminotransferase family protein [Candidatus Omnitrophota bacterium]MBU4467662.1 pyridoxal phosphate-dependent aminotransferase family protein [Candidatus Omnitrophota bacterium]MCG2707486.1 pyridoxal phosphate-dependent aminotransferase family protein [Candidatus Omnitrophota bacterium]
MRRVNFYSGLDIDLSLAHKYDFNPYYCNIESSLSDPIIIDGKEFINLASNNYLGLAADKRVAQAIAQAAEKYGASMCGTPIATGSMVLLQRLEQRLANFIGLQDSIIFPSGYQANCALFLSLAQSEDLIIIDHYAHASLVQGVRLAGCKVKPFLHNNVSHLRKILEKSSEYKRVFVVTESVFSTEGSIAPFDEIVNLCAEFDALPVIDDSHGIGVIGRSGRGILEEKNLDNFDGIYTASLGKALANTGGIISGKKELIDYLKYSCPGFIYSTALPPPVLAGIEAVLDIIDKEFPILSERMWRYKQMISNCLIDSGFELTEGQAPITSILIKDLEDCARVAKMIHTNKILATPFVPPSVPPNENKIRLIAGANLSENTINKALDLFRKIGKEVNLK